jgi:hypothetical protein
VLGCSIVVAPWVVRNWLVLGTPILTTTHGGYTLLLGNNPSFYGEVARQPWGTTWDGSTGPGQAAWLRGVESELRDAGVRGEVARDRWMHRRAIAHIANDPTGFLRASLLRFLWFWNVIPLGEARSGWPDQLVWVVGGFYSVLWVAVAAGIWDVLRSRDGRWLAALVVIASFAAVHLVYWSNARMRAPLVPLLSLLAVRGCLAITGRRSEELPRAHTDAAAAVP